MGSRLGSLIVLTFHPSCLKDFLKFLAGEGRESDALLLLILSKEYTYAKEARSEQLDDTDSDCESTASSLDTAQCQIESNVC